ncbi:DUF2523 domain-containing protein [Uliginosibacterium aquaticum]|uniref:DUF2523 domain-containing protein n=1 Tax=Uliginosibacterium aquaticum TaxID=2731212 RepID=A0ABX2ILC8_9RHOO|nr:DUF2523 domain-containing protein [Uliginosibacterium aquaticum]NSL54915.1 DUF2523 domain-containing protein [Uliginosibacterium aquaticum]
MALPALGAIAVGALVTWLADNFAGLVKRALIAVGIGAVSYAALSSLSDAVTGYVVGYYGQLPANIAQLLGLGGIPQAIGIVLSAFVARAAMMAASKLEYIAK